jgi:hypothetical protein
MVRIIIMLCLFSWIAVDVDDDDDDGDDDDLTSISNTTHSKNNEHIVLSQLECRFFNI